MADAVVAEAAVASAATSVASAGAVGGEEQDKLHGWHLHKKEAEFIGEINDMYKHLGIVPMPPEIAPFKVEQSHGWMGNYFRAAFPVTHSDIHIPDPHSIGFIGKEANSLSVTLRNFKLTEIHEDTPHDRHAAAALVVNEFHHFVRKLAGQMNPTSDVINDVGARINLIECFITRCNIGMHKYRPFLALMVKIKEELGQIVSLWPAFRAQQKLQEQIRAVKLHVDAALLRLLGYSFYVLKCEAGDFSFDPQDWHPEIKDTESVHDKLMHWLMLQENVYNAVTNHSIDREKWTKRLMDTGHEGDILHQMSDTWTDPSSMSEPVLQIGDMRGDESGLPSNVFAFETDMSPEQRRSAIELWLTLVREAVGFAIGAQMMDHAYTLSCLGGELLIAKQTSKDLALSTLKFVRNRLAEVQTTMLALDKIMLPVLAKGKMKNSENYVWNNVTFTNWSKNYEYAKTHCAPGILTHANEARSTICSLETEIQDLDIAQVEKKIGDVGKSLISLCKNSCKLFNEHDGIPDVQELEVPQLLPDVPQSLKALETKIDSETRCIESGSSLSSVGYLSSGRSWTAMFAPAVAKTEFAKFIMKVTLERPGEYEDDENEVQVVEFWKRMGFEDVAEVVQLRSGGEPVLGVSCMGLEALCGLKHYAQVVRQLPVSDPKAQRATLSGELKLSKERSGALKKLLADLEEDLGQRIPPGHSQILLRDLALELDMGEKNQVLQAVSMGFPSKKGGIVTMVRLQITLEVTGKCCVNSRLHWDADLAVLVLPSLKEVVARVFEMSRGVPGAKMQTAQTQAELTGELFQLISSGTEIFQRRFSPERYPEVQQWLRKGYSVTAVEAKPLNSDSCTIC
ncbi:unnamed protein product [Effrenium voratum]|uniref:Uncharacterized protein n=1 Tax=Effrenium voratum TaxID=2562239 RepID=A0AA36N000_9DINO|nr:unnamed protein product [Effrenium voratum]CAJ1389646.1 unnamed protein product [Effrenium voratum]CAJ1428660.1 unnamed protein product [Effrenium voratum]